jgi:hypothetical protein
MTEQKVQDVAADQFRKNDKFTKKVKGTDNTSRQTLHQEVEQDETETAADGDDNGCDDEVSTDSEGVSEGVAEKHTRGRDWMVRHLKRVVVYTSNSFVDICDKEQNVVQAKCCIMLESTGKTCGTTVEIRQRSPKPCWNHLQKHHKTEFLTLKMTQVHILKGLYVHALV